MNTDFSTPECRLYSYPLREFPQNFGSFINIILMPETDIFQVNWKEQVDGLEVWANLYGSHVKQHKAIAQQCINGGAIVVRCNLWWSPMSHDIYRIDDPVFYNPNYKLEVLDVAA